MGSKGGTTQTTNNEPPAWAAPLLTQSASAAQNLYNQGIGFNPYPGSTVAPLSGATQAGIGALQGVAQGAMTPGSSLYNLSQNPVNLSNAVFESGGQTPAGTAALGYLGQLMSGGLNPSTAGFGAALGQINNPASQTATEGYGGAASGALNSSAGAGYGNIVNAGGLNGTQQGALGTLGGVASGQNAINTGGQYGALGQQALTQNQGIAGSLGQTAANTGQLGSLAMSSTAPWLGGLSGAAGQSGALANQALSQGQGYQAGLGQAANTTAQLGQLAGQPGAAEQYLTGTAQGNYLGGNPYLMAAMAPGAQAIADQTNGMFASSGRYGSGANQGVLQGSLNNYYNTALAQNYNAERANQLQAANALENAQNTGLAQGLTAAGQQANILGQGASVGSNAISQALGGLGQSANIMGQGAGLQQQGIGQALTAAGQQAGMLGQQAGINSSGLEQALAATQGQTGVQSQNIGNQLAAAGQQAGIGAQGMQATLQGLGGQASVDAQNAATQLQGLGGLASQGQNNFGNTLQGVSSLFNAQQGNLANQTGAATSGAQIGNQGLGTALGYLGQLPTTFGSTTFGGNTALQSGAIQDQNAQAQLNAQIAQWQQQQILPWTQLGALQAAAQGAAGPYGMATTQMQQPSSLTSLLGPVAMMAMGL